MDCICNNAHQQRVCVSTCNKNSQSSFILYERRFLSIIIFHNHFLFLESNFLKISHLPFLTSILWCWYYWICLLYDIPSYIIPSDACLAFVNSLPSVPSLLPPPPSIFSLTVSRNSLSSMAH